MALAPRVIASLSFSLSIALSLTPFHRAARARIYLRKVAVAIPLDDAVSIGPRARKS